MCQLPMDMGLTDDKQHHLLRLRGNQLLVYENCTPKQVMYVLMFRLDSLCKWTALLYHLSSICC